MFKKFIERPVLATVISILLVILGILGLTKLPLQKFPDIAPPSVQVTALYPGANAETILRPYLSAMIPYGREHTRPTYTVSVRHTSEDSEEQHTWNNS